MRRAATFLLASVAVLGWADDGWWSGAGGAGSYGKSHPTIRMVSEDLKIRLQKDESGLVDVTFRFRNEGKATDVTMAFPEEYEQRVGSSLDHFRSWVNGRPVAVRRKVFPLSKDVDPKEGDTEYKAVRLKTVHFAANQTLTVRVAYRGYFSGNTSGDRSFTYILTTGASWKGPIGTCRMTVSWPDWKGLSMPYPNLPARWRMTSAHSMTGTMTNWEPEDDLYVAMLPRFGNFWINGQPWLGHDNFYPLLGDPKDPMISISEIEHFFGNSEKDITWGPQAVRWFGGPFKVANSVVTLHSGKQRRLRRTQRMVKAKDTGDPDANRYVFIKDLVEALGGRYRYNAALQRTEIAFP